MKKELPPFGITLPKYLENEALPWMIWIHYKGEECVACVNYERSLKAKRPMIDISYCMTKALNNIVLQTVAFNPKHFAKSKLN